VIDRGVCVAVVLMQEEDVKDKLRFYLGKEKEKEHIV
jgi:hypothetical protein